MKSRQPGPRGIEPVEFIVGYDALAVFLHPDNPIGAFTFDQLAAIYGEGGAFESWTDLGVTVPGCSSDEIVRVSRQNNSGTYAYFQEAVLGEGEYKLGSRDMHGSKDVVDLVENTPCAIGYSGLAYATDHVKMPCVSAEEGAPCIRPSYGDCGGQELSYLPSPVHVHGRGAGGRHQGVPGLDPERRRSVHPGGEGLCPCPRRPHLLDPFGGVSARSAPPPSGSESSGRMSAVTHYEERLERDLGEIRSRVRAVGDLVEEQVRDAIQALLTMDPDLANQVILKDRIVNRETRDLDRLCHGFVVRHLPVAHHLRYVSAVLRMDVALERVGDYAVTICRHSIRCSTLPPPTDRKRPGAHRPAGPVLPGGGAEGLPRRRTWIWPGRPWASRPRWTHPRQRLRGPGFRRGGP